MNRTEDRSTGFDPAPAARRLAAAWRNGTLLTELPAVERPDTIADGYTVQADVRRRLGEPVAGYKLGLANRLAMRKAGLATPPTGVITGSRVHQSGARLPAPSGPILFELEVCFTVGAAVPAGGSAADKLAAMAEARLGIELVRSRFADFTTVGLASFVADDLGFDGYVLGDAIDRADWPSVFADYAEIARSGAVVAPNVDGDARTDPVEALSMFIDDAAARGLPLTPGTIVSTGALVAPQSSAAAGTYVGRLGDHRVSCEIAAAR